MELIGLENLFQSLTASITGLNADANVRISWPTEGAPAWKITDNMIFLRVATEDRPYNRQRETEHSYAANPEAFVRTVSFTRIASVFWTLYGPDSFSYAQLLRDSLFYQENHDTLAENNLYLIPDIVEPKRIPELFEGRWWERVDLTMFFNELVTRVSTAQFIDTADVLIQHVDGSLEINVTE